ncbi:hypothetical protein Ciccas_001108 [Cichlidogyrus casuarinus]|uniref:BACK domain-containing protein n=1 Tax=Cichlidogyrus casuarinus TaxID=1844966 RepID=A0ABD2QL24_9PLAT
MNWEEETKSFKSLLDAFPCQDLLRFGDEIMINGVKTGLKVCRYTLGTQNKLFMQYFKDSYDRKTKGQAKTILLSCEDKKYLKYFAFIIHFSHMKSCKLTLTEGVDSKINGDHIESSLDEAFLVANIFQNTILKNACLSFLREQLCTTNCVDLLQIFEDSQEHQGSALTKDFIMSYFPLIEPSYFAPIDEKLLTSLLQSERLNVNSEIQVVKAIEAWSQSNHVESTSNKEVILKRLLSACVRYNYGLDETTKAEIDRLRDSLSISFRKGPRIKTDLSSFVEDRWTRDFREWLAVRSSRKRKHSNNSSNKVDPLAQSFRLPHEAILVLGGFYSGLPTSTIYVLNSKKMSWHCEPRALSLHKPLMGHSVCLVANRFIYVSGGEDSQYQVWQEVFVMDLKNPQNGWSKCPLMYEKRRNHVFVHDDKTNRLIVAGGNNGRRVVGYVEALCLDDDERNSCWSDLPTLQIARGGACGAIIDRKLYVCGGYTDQSMENITSSVEVLNLDSSIEWTSIKPMTQERYFSCCLAIQGYLFVLGGGSSATVDQRMATLNEQVGSTVERYNPLTNSWELMPYMGERADFSACFFEGHIWCLGGGVDHVQLAKVEKWKPFLENVPVGDRPVSQMGSWIPQLDLPFPMWGHQCISIKGLDLIGNLFDKNSCNYFTDQDLFSPTRLADVRLQNGNWNLVVQKPT